MSVPILYNMVIKHVTCADCLTPFDKLLASKYGLITNVYILCFQHSHIPPTWVHFWILVCCPNLNVTVPFQNKLEACIKVGL